MAQQKRAAELPHVFTGSVEHAIAHIEESIQGMVDDRYLRWYAVKVFERDEKVLADLNLSTDLRAHLEDHIVDCEKELDDDAESIITNQRYAYINDLVTKAVKKKGEKHRLSTSDKIDQIVTNRILALPIFAVVMFAVYWIAMGPFGTFLTDWTNDVLGTAWLVEIPRAALEGWGVNEVVVGLICDGALAGVGAVLGFVPQMLVLFLMLAILEDIGYMARIAFIMDRIFRKFGLSGRAIPMLVGTGCGVPGVMASRTIENERDRRMTVMTTCFIPCGAKMPIIGLIAGTSSVAPAWWRIRLLHRCGGHRHLGIILKKTKMFAGDRHPFVMELPAYHIPSVGNVLRATWEQAGPSSSRPAR
ncbi:MAG: nucleoside recognition domain-containing protein [Dysosmobacter welbionis]